MKQTPSKVPVANRRSLFLAAGILMLAGLCFSCKKEDQEKPNIVYILADDLGYGDVSVYNPDSKISTPHIDGLAEEGMRFTDAHSPSAVCTPTRYSILTGRYAWRSRKPVGVLRGYSRTLIEPGRATVATLLKACGYETAVIGKWHLGLDWQVKEDRRDLLQKEGYGIEEEMAPEDIDFTGSISGGPQEAGFTYSYILPASLDMPPYCYLENQVLAEIPAAYTEGSALDSGYTGPFWRPGKMASSFDFMQVLPTFITKAKEFLNRQEKKRPFFLFLPLTGPHTPWLPDVEHRGKSAAGEYGDFVRQVDDAVGAVLEELDKLGYSENTMVIFTSDNGPFWREEHIAKFAHRAAGPYRGMKADIYEGGHRIPFIVKWPGRTRAGQVSEATTTLTNLVATVAEITGGKKVPGLPEDSYSILSVLTGKSGYVEGQPAVVHSASNGYYAIREGDWKLIQGLGSGGFTEPKTLIPAPGQPKGQLYNLAEDAGETTDLYQKHPEKVKELTEKLEAITNSRERIWSSAR
ncbi:sulfatase-like hydrolase/transferase [Ravibacter arvi]|uniref:Sulfatase-like hydrolase/transferase n=1 Tax=Ravibacter arvi TaxID=2051041 RepID=A0ABP8LLS6_9BACT